jgi:hypothetical protein
MRIALVSPLSSKTIAIGKSPLSIRSEIPLPAELLQGTTWDEAQEEIALAAFPNMVPISFGAVISSGVTPGNEIIEVFLVILPEHSE